MKLNPAEQSVTKLTSLIITALIITIFTSCDFDLNFEPPVIANFTATPNSGSASLSVDFICDASDPDGEIVNYKWDFGDGKSATTSSGDVNHIYQGMGNFTAIVVVTDNDGLVDTSAIDFDLNFEPPVIANFTATPNSGSAPLSVDFICDASDPDGEIVNYKWDFGVGESVTTSSGNVNHIYREMGSFTAIVLVTDNDGLVDTSAIIIDVLPTSVSDNFNDGNADGWFERDTYTTYRVENGEYSIEGTNGGQHKTTHPFGPGGNFSFEAKVKYISGNLGSLYGIGILDSDDRYTWLFIDKYGFYGLAYIDTEWHYISNWIYSSSINTNVGDSNILKLIKSGSALKIYINNSYLGSFSSSSIGVVKAIGLNVAGDSHIHFDDVVAEEL